jgi:hypothetical protein
MKEPFVDLETLIQQTTLLSDMELQSYLAGLSESQKTEFVVSNVKGAVDSVKQQKSTKFNDLFDQMIGADNNVTSTAYYIARTKDLTDFADDVDDMMVNQLNATDVNAGLAARQNEINEWSNFNKLDTLYIMQILFVSLSFIGILAFLLSNGTITQALFAFVSYFIAAIAVVMLIIRWRYTNVARDGRYWHKAKFQKQPNVYVAPVCPTTGAASGV